MPFTLEDTIVAIATAPGAAGLAVVRLSGSRALSIADHVFRGACSLGEAPGHTLHYGWVVEGAEGRRLDEVVAGVFRAPRSYTREDVVELSCHGGSVSAERVLAALIAAGARMARPGEFTLRAFLNGRLDLAQSEAVADIIHAETRAAHDLALAQLAGALSNRIAALSDRVADLLSEVEARVDFAEDVGGVEVPEHVIVAIGAVAGELVALLQGAAFARAVREGVRVPLVGRPNAGKSSLFNALLGEERAIVTDVPGTTRDRVSEAIEIAGVRITLSDTAGLRESSEPVEAIGVERTRESLRDSALVLWVVDGATPLDDEERGNARGLHGKRVVVAMNKSDLPAAVTPGEIETLLAGALSRAVVVVSALDRTGLDDLRGAIAAALGPQSAGNGAGFAGAVCNARHAEALERARAALERAAAAGADAAPGEIVAIELRDSLAAMGEITGRDMAEDLLDRIFGKFCIGK